MNTNLLLHLRALLRKTGGVTIAALMFALPTHAAELSYSSIPLFWATGVQPNVMMMIDNSGSMVGSGSQDTGQTYPIVSTCNGATINDYDGVNNGENITRWEAAQQAACQVVKDNAASMRIGFGTFDGSGRTVTTPSASAVENDHLYVLREVGSSETDLLNSISAAPIGSGTPLSGTMYDLTRMMRGKSYLSHNGNGSAARVTVTTPTPIQYRCQKNYVLFFTDGEPTGDMDSDDTPDLYASGDPTSTPPWTGATGLPNWDGYSDIISGSNPWVDDFAQMMYDIDIQEDGSASTITACPSGSALGASTDSKDCADKSWDGDDDTGDNATDYAKQNVVTYTIGFGNEANNEMMRDTPLVNQKNITSAMVNTSADTITLTDHGLSTGDYVLYYKPTTTTTTVTGYDVNSATSDQVFTADTSGMVNGTELTYSNGGGANLQYNVVGSYTPTCGAIGGLTSGNTYYIKAAAANTFTLTATLTGTTINLSGTGVTDTVHGFSRAAVSANSQTAVLNSTGTNPINQSTETISITSHGFSTGDIVTYTCAGANCIGGLTTGNTYYIARTGTNTFRLATSAANAATCAASGTSCINISRPGTAGTTATFARAAVAANSISVTANSASTTPVNTGTETITSAAHGFSANDSVTYTCANGAPVVTNTNTTGTTYYAVVISPTQFMLAASSADATTTPTPVTLDITVAGNAAQTFSFDTTPKIGGLYAYETDIRPDGTPDPATESAARGKYFVDEVDEDTIQLRECGDSYTVGSDTVYCGTGAAGIVNLTTAGSGVLSTGPGKSYFSTTAAALSTALTSAFTAIRADTLSQASLAVNTSQLGAGAQVYQASFNTGDWSGDISAFAINTTTGAVSTTADWEASQYVPASRNILTWNGSTGTVFPSGGTSGLTATQLNSVNSDFNVVDWVRGNTVSGFRTRSNGLYGDILSGSPAYVGESSGNYDTMLPATASGRASYASYKAGTASRTPMLYVGANDGMLHGIDASDGSEVVGFIPNGVYRDWIDLNDDGQFNGAEVAIQKFYELTQTNYGQVADQPHHYFVDGKPRSGDAYFGGSWHTVVVGGLGKGGRSVYALDVTDPSSFDVNDILWEFAGTSGSMGYSFSRPVIARLQNDQWVAIFGNGYDGNGDLGRLFVVNLEDGSLISQIDVTGSTGLSSVSVYTDATSSSPTFGGATAVYAGDLAGNIWKFDISNFSPASWTYSQFFTAQDTGGNPQPITSPITLGSNATTGTGVMLYFGTGTYFQDDDKSYSGTPINDTLYGLWDNGSSVNSSKSQLQQQTLGTNGSYRTVSTNTVSYSGTLAGSRGWYINLVVGGVYEGERMVNPPLLAGNVLFATTVVPSNTDPCTGGGTSWLMGINALTGAAATIFDIDEDGVFETNVSGIQSGNGVYSEATYLDDGSGNNTGRVFVGASGGTVDSFKVDTCPGCGGGSPPSTLGLQSGRMTWRQLQ